MLANHVDQNQAMPLLNRRHQGWLVAPILSGLLLLPLLREAARHDTRVRDHDTGALTRHGSGLFLLYAVYALAPAIFVCLFGMGSARRVSNIVVAAGLSLALVLEAFVSLTSPLTF